MAMLATNSSGERCPGEAVRHRLVAFVRVLRDNGFATGFAETEDALVLLTDPIAKHGARLRPAFRALFCGRRSDWEKFDEIFAAFWLGRGVKPVLRTSGSPSDHRATPSRSTAANDPLAISGDPDRAERVPDQAAAAAADGHSRREGASREERLAKTDFRHMTDPAEV
jgi:uncharacterized protein with von Willebrand factor type A (vWA) domain